MENNNQNLEKKVKSLFWYIGIPVAIAFAISTTLGVISIQPESKKHKQERAFREYENREYENLHYNTRLMENIEIYRKNGKLYLNIIGRKGYPQKVLQDMR